MDVTGEGVGGIDLQRGADYQQDLGAADDGGGFVQQRYAFAEPDDVRTHGVAVRVAVVQGLVGVAGDDVAGVGTAAGFVQFAVQVQHAAAAGAFVEVVHVLRDDVGVEVLFQTGEGKVGSVRFGGLSGAAAGVVEIQHELRVARPCFGRAYVFYAVFRPQAAAVAEGGQSAFRADAGTGEYGEGGFVAGHGSFLSVVVGRRILRELAGEGQPEIAWGYTCPVRNGVAYTSAIRVGINAHPTESVLCVPLAICTGFKIR